MTEILDEAAVSEIEKRANAATKGDWTIRGGSWIDGSLPLAGYGVRFTEASEKYSGWDARTNFPPETPTGKQASADRTFIAHAREDIPALCATVKHLRTRQNALEQALRPLWAISVPSGTPEPENMEELMSDLKQLPRSARPSDLQSQLEQLRAERDALQKGLKEHCRCGQQGSCSFCVIQRETKL